MVAGSFKHLVPAVDVFTLGSVQQSSPVGDTGTNPLIRATLSLFGGFDRLDGPVFKFMWTLIGVVAFFYAFQSAISLRRAGRSGSGYGMMGGASPISYMVPFAYFLVAVLMIRLDQVIMVVNGTFSGGASITSYSQSSMSKLGLTAEGEATLRSLFLFVRFIGFVGVFRGLNMIKKVATSGSVPGGGGASYGRAAVFVVAGSIAFNIFWWIDILRTTFNI